MNCYEEIKKIILNNEIKKMIKDYSKNKNDLDTYYKVGKLLNELQKNNQEIKEYSVRLTNEIGKGYSVTNLKYMIKFYLHFKEQKDIHNELNWSHYVELLSLTNPDQINYYIKISLEENLSYRELHRKIKNKEHEKINIIDKNIISKNSNIIQNILDKTKQQNNNNIIIEIKKQIIIENISNIIKTLGNDYSFIDSEYKIKNNDNTNYIDLLLYNIEFNCYVVGIIKNEKATIKDIQQIKKYTNYIDTYKKTQKQNNTIGIIIYKKYNQFLIEYCTDKRLYKSKINN